MFGRGGVVAIVYRHTEMPLTKVSGAVAFVFQDFGERRFTPKQMHSVTLFTEDGIDSGADVIAAGEKSGARRGADRRSGMEIGEAHALGGQLVEDRGLDWTPVTAEVTVAQVVDEQSDDVRVFVLGKTGTNKKQEAKKGEDGLHVVCSVADYFRGFFMKLSESSGAVTRAAQSFQRLMVA